MGLIEAEAAVMVELHPPQLKWLWFAVVAVAAASRVTLTGPNLQRDHLNWPHPAVEGVSLRGSPHLRLGAGREEEL